MNADTWEENFFSLVTVSCKNDFCTNEVTTTVCSAARSGGVYCDACRAEAKRQHSRNYDTGKRNRQRREATRAAQATPRTCARPDCNKTFTGPMQRKLCDLHSTVVS